MASDLRTSTPLSARVRRACDEAAQQAATALDLPVGLLVLLGGDGLQVVGAHGLTTSPEQAATWPFLWNAMHGSGPLVVEDCSREPRVARRPQQAVPGVRCFAAVPVFSVRGGLGTGALGVAGPEPRRLPEHAVDALLRVRDALLHRVDVGVL